MRKLLLLISLIGSHYSCTRPALPHPPVNWQNLDLEKDGFFGISTEKAYARWLQHKKPATVIVAVFDSGIDTAHEDLQSTLWTDPNNGSHGWNYLGPETGKEDFIRLLEIPKNDYDSRYGDYQKTLDNYNLHLSNLDTFMSRLKESKRILDGIVENIGSKDPSRIDLEFYIPRDEQEEKVLDLVLARFQNYPDFESLRYNEVDHLLDLGRYHLEHGLSRERLPEDSSKPVAGNSDVGYDAFGLLEDPNVMPGHGTNMSGIIAGTRNNGKGINGIADDVQIIMLKLFSNIREVRDEDLARAIRFAVDRGARVLSMSFGRPYSINKAAVDEAVQYAMSRDVLIVHSAGNNAMDLDAAGNSFFPSGRYLDGGNAAAWITVGASGSRDDSTLAAPFSNYGHRSVDVFAPGVQITSTMPHSKYVRWDGTSEATPVVAGLAALIREYFPLLTAVQVKNIIMTTVVKRSSLENKCISGGVVNAYKALELAHIRSDEGNGTR